MPPLNASNRPVNITSDYTIYAPQMRGAIEQIGIGDSDDRTRPDDPDDLWTPLLADAEITTEAAFALKATDPKSTGNDDQFRQDPSTPVTREGDEALVFTAKYTQPNTNYAILYRDEAGIFSWIFPNQQAGQPVRSGGELTFHLPRAGAPEPPDDDSDTRGPFTAGGRRVIRLLRWTIRDAVGDAVLWGAQKFEERKRQYGLHHVAQGTIGGPVDWDHLRGGRALLLTHGAFSTCEASFGALVENARFAQLAAQYENRIFAFNHPSMTETPRENIQWLLDRLPAESALDLDIVAHSRGGLVARTIAEQLGQLNQNGRHMAVNKAIFVGTPHQGTVMADGEHWYDLVDRYTNFMTGLPDNAYTITAEAILAVVKLLAYGGLDGLPGIRTMLPQGEYLQKMNNATPHPSTYYAISANFAPDDKNLKAKLRDRATDFVMDRIFEGADNDGVVPSEGCYQVATPSHGFPIPPERHHRLASEALVHHLNYFMHDGVVAQLVDWLK